MTDPLQHLRARFLTRCAEDLALLEAADPRAPSEAARRAVHRLAGTAGMFGHDQLGRLALALDDELQANRPLARSDLDALLQDLRRLS